MEEGRSPPLSQEALPNFERDPLKPAGVTKVNARIGPGRPDQLRCPLIQIEGKADHLVRPSLDADSSAKVFDFESVEQSISRVGIHPYQHGAEGSRVPGQICPKGVVVGNLSGPRLPAINQRRGDPRRLDRLLKGPRHDDSLRAGWGTPCRALFRDSTGTARRFNHDTRCF